MNFQEFKDKWNNEILPNESSFIRQGQSLMNYLFLVRTDLHNLIYELEPSVRNNTDPFYSDRYIGNALEFLKKNWDYNEKNYLNVLDFLSIRGFKKDSKIDLDYLTRVMESYAKVKNNGRTQ